MKPGDGRRGRSGGAEKMKNRPVKKEAGRGRRRAVNKVPSDNYQRIRAGGCLEENFLVEAGAGTGKTSLIMERLRNIICSRDIPMDGIVAITFTEKAAGELRSRLREELERWLLRAEGNEKERIGNALRGMDRAAISTIHSFCSSLLRERPVEAGVDPGFRVADEVQAEELLDRAWEQWLHERMVPGNKRLRLAFSLGATLQSARTLADAFTRCRDMLGWIPGPSPLPEPSVFLDRVAEDAAVFRGLMAAHLKDPGDKLVLEGRKVERFLEWCRERVSAENAGDRSAAGSLTSDEIWETLSSEMAGLKIKTKRTGSAAKWSSKESLESARGVLSRACDQIQNCMKTLSHNAVAGLAEELKIFVGLYEKAKIDQGVLDYDDLLIGARNLLRDSREARNYYKAKFKVILVDEFQDTDPLQAEVAFFLAERSDGHSDSWQDVELEPGKLFLVGDPKQSIYRFRGADIEVYERSKRSLERFGETLSISVNFRSTPGVIDPVNLTFEEIMRPPEDGHYQPRYEALNAHREGGSPGIVLLRPESELQDDCRADEKRAYEASAIAWSVREVVERRQWSVFDKRAGADRSVRYGDIALLFWATTGLGVYEEALRSWEIPYRVAGGRAFYARTEIRALVSVLTAIENPHNGVAVVGALRSPFFGLADDEIFLGWTHTGGLNYTAVSMKGDVERAFGVLRSLREERNQRPLGSFLDLLFEKTGVVPALFMRPHGDQRVANLIKMSALASKLEETGPVTFKRFLRWVERQSERGVDEGESPLQEAGDDFVTVLTIHKAKGLEFPVVYLPGLWAKGRKGAESVVIDRGKEDLQISLSKNLGLVTEGWESASKREENVLEAEKIRLLYVAMTRARERLVLPCLFGAGDAAETGGEQKKALGARSHESGPSINRDKTQGHFARLKPVVDCALSGSESWSEALEIPAKGLEKRREKALRIAGPHASTEKGDYGAINLSWKESLAGVLKAVAVAEAVISPTGLLGPLESATAIEGGAAREMEGIQSEDVGRRIGTLVHSVLEMDSRWDADEMAGLAMSLGRELGLSSSSIDRAAWMLRAFGESAFAGRIRASLRVRREVPFSVTIGATVEGAADLVMEEEDGWRIVDFKTDSVVAGEVGERAEHYRLQGGCYALCLSRVLKRPVREVIFYFLSPQMEYAFDVDEAMLRDAERAVTAGAAGA